MSKKPLIFLCDDKKKWTKLFGYRHGLGKDIRQVWDRIEQECSSDDAYKHQINEWIEKDDREFCDRKTTRAGRDVEVFEGAGPYKVITTNRALDFCPILKELVKQKEMPNIVLIDLYHPHNSNNTAVLEKGDEAIKSLNAAVKDAKIPIEAAWSAQGLDLLQEARTLLKRAGSPNTPIAIYTEQGLTLASVEVGGNMLKRVSESQGEWFVKGQIPFYEDAKLRSMDEESRLANANLRNAKITRYVLWGLAGTIFVASLAVSPWTDWRVKYLPDAAAVLGSFLAPFIIRRLQERN